MLDPKQPPEEPVEITQSGFLDDNEPDEEIVYNELGEEE